jgi:hypothetical protein
MFLNNLQEIHALKTSRARNRDVAICADSLICGANARNPVHHAKQIRYNYI